jgi:hypothetical protein
MDKKNRKYRAINWQSFSVWCIATPSFRIYIVMPKKKELVPTIAFYWRYYRLLCATRRDSVFLKLKARSIAGNVEIC